MKCLVLAVVAAACSPGASGSSGSSGGAIAPVELDVYDQPNGKRVVAHLHAGEHYTEQKRGGPGHQWCKLAIAGVEGWVLCAPTDEPPGPRARTPDTPGGPDRPGAGNAPIPPPTPPAGTPTPRPTAMGDFAYYVLTLSWSPSFCETPAGANSPEQCASGRHYAFVVHGLWPQRERGYPEHCAAASTALPQSVVDAMLPIMPSAHLVHHEWETHGTCSGLAAADYFATIRDAFAAVHIPDRFVAPTDVQTVTGDDVAAAFLAANPALARADLAIQCKRELDEVRICLDKDLHPRACGSDVRDACKHPARVPPIR